MHGFITLWDATSYDNWLLQVERYSKEDDNSLIF